MPVTDPEQIFSQMNREQRIAACHGTGPMLVLAGPGSGKTFVITNRISYLTEHLKVPPEHILVITFTKEAAVSMQNRFHKSYGGMRPVNFGTFHAVFYQILKRSVSQGFSFKEKEASFDKAGPILTDSQKRKVIMPVLQKLQEEKEGLEETASQCLAAISFYKNTARADKAEEMLPQALKGCFHTLLEEYENARKHIGKLDFDDMVYDCLKLLQSDENILRFWQNQFRYILIDEFQDINPMQYEVIHLLSKAGRNIFAVGDDDQSIYGFRSSEPALMKQFLLDYPECKQVTLRLNYRSRPEIVKASLQVIEENKERFPKDLQAFQKDLKTEAVKLHGFETQEAQCQYLTEQLRKEEFPEECAVLFRTNARMQSFAATLHKAGIPYFMKEKSSCIYDHFIAKDLDAYIRFACGDYRRSLFLTIMNKPFRDLEREALADEWVDFSKIEDFYHRYAEPQRFRQASCELKKLEAGLRQIRMHKPYLGVQYLRKGIGYENYLRQRAGTDSDRLTEWMEILEFLTAEAGEYSDYGEWQEAQEMVRLKMARLGNGRKRSAQDEKGIRLMTVHASKGLEFPKVYLPDVNEGIYPHGHMPDAGKTEEERRMLYVAMTRAKEALELTFVTGTKERPALPSRFLNPLLQKDQSCSSVSSNRHSSRYSSNASSTSSYSSSSSI